MRIIVCKNGKGAWNAVREPFDTLDVPSHFQTYSEIVTWLQIQYPDDRIGVAAEDIGLATRGSHILWMI